MPIVTMAAASQCKATTTLVSDCITSLVELSETLEPNPTPPEASARPWNGVFSPWNRTAFPTKTTCTRFSSAAPGPPSSSSPSSPSPSPPKRKKVPGPYSSPGGGGRADTKPAVANDDAGRTVSALPNRGRKFRGVFLTSQRLLRVSTGFQHSRDSRHYIERYRHLHHPASGSSSSNCAVKGRVGRGGNMEEEGGEGDPSPSRCSSVRPGGMSSASPNKGNMTGRCSRAQRGLCPHYVPRSPCVKTARQAAATAAAADQQSWRPAADPASHVTTSTITPFGGVTGNHVQAARRHVAEGGHQRGRVCLSKDRRAIIVETQSCKRIRITWRQYLKYFSKPTLHSSNRRSDQSDERCGYTARPTTPCSPSPSPPPGSPRAATCVPVLNYDQSRVGTPVSAPPVLRENQSARRKQLRSDSLWWDGRRDDGDKSGDVDAGSARLPSSGKRRDVHTCPGVRYDVDHSGAQHPARRRVSICTVMDIQEAIRKLQVSLEVCRSRPPHLSDTCQTHR